MSQQVLTTLDFVNVGKIINLPDAVNDQEPVTLAQLRAQTEGQAWKDDVVVDSAANINIASPGATINGYAVTLNDRVLLRGQTAAAENGIYIFNGTAVPLTRSPDMNSGPEFNGAVVTVTSGPNAGTSWRQTATGVVVGAATINWVTFGQSAPVASTGSAGIAALATQAEVDAGAVADKIVTPATLANWSNRKLKVSQVIGDGSATAYTVTHNFNSRNVVVRVFRNSGNYDDVLVDVTRPSVNAVTITFNQAPAANSFVVVVIG